MKFICTSEFYIIKIIIIIMSHYPYCSTPALFFERVML